MNGFTLARVEPVSLGVHEPAWDQPSRQHQRRKPRYAARRRVLQAVAPGRAPETCEVLCEFDPEGELVGVIVRDIESGAEIAHLSIEQFARLSADGEQRGLLFERRG